MCNSYLYCMQHNLFPVDMNKTTKKETHCNLYHIVHNMYYIGTKMQIQMYIIILYHILYDVYILYTLCRCFHLHSTGHTGQTWTGT